ncbi:Heat shock protein HslJ [Vibrio ruber DSM 16370]|uniref:Heat shock protein HslJ n=1 Tax=Vibrio ruber (strain DSM 16370 / JCM 11486 / BCRC 17186 / CECT 7878 / LMG 23124 / VR1) TaxID=1123498 RepID=A0A1R4LJW1_VIBR1|nr:META domain-containing protein [Vibrio ruber]SJN56763.1 Heat shock protein HslJ [Vibrio ruber DSM 16370]
MKLSSKAIATTVTFAAFLAGLAGCASKDKPIQLSELQTPQWHLIELDGKALEQKGKKTPSLNVDEKLTATGLAGCNDYVGEVEIDVDDHEFRLTHVNSTMKLCLKNEMALNNTIISALSEWNRIDIDKNKLTLKGEKHTLVFQAQNQ